MFQHGHLDPPAANVDGNLNVGPPFPQSPLIGADGIPIPGYEFASISEAIGRTSTHTPPLFTKSGAEARPLQILERQQKKMEDLTQKSSLSLTQPNSEAVYERFDIQAAIRDDYPSTANETEDAGDTPSLPPNSDSLRSKQHTNSTTHTYEEDDTGHVTLDFQPENEDGDDLEPEPQSQDASSVAPLVAEPQYQADEPRTPGLTLKNPFNQKGSVMKPSDLFRATQPSSVAKGPVSPTSSRPSPDVYNDFSSPVKRQRIGSSPLLYRNEHDDQTSISPLQSSVRNILIPRKSGIKSFDVRSKKISRAESREPRPYVSMQESQERRSRAQNSDSGSGSDSDIEARPRINRRKIDAQIQKEISTVELRRRVPPSSSRPSSAVQVEVPSTGRRRSFQDDYLAQCNGSDARDTQQDEFIADSQALPSRASSAPDAAAPETTTVIEVLPESPAPVNAQNDLDPNPSPDVAERILATSPAAAEEHLRPLRELAGVSFNGDAEDLRNLPGFTQDEEFENAMKIMSSPAPPSRSFRKEAEVPIESGPPQLDEMRDSPPPSQLTIAIEQKEHTEPEASNMEIEMPHPSDQPIVPQIAPKSASPGVSDVQFGKHNEGGQDDEETEDEESVNLQAPAVPLNGTKGEKEHIKETTKETNDDEETEDDEPEILQVPMVPLDDAKDKEHTEEPNDEDSADVSINVDMSPLPSPPSKVAKTSRSKASKVSTAVKKTKKKVRGYAGVLKRTVAATASSNVSTPRSTPRSTPVRSVKVATRSSERIKGSTPIPSRKKPPIAAKSKRQSTAVVPGEESDDPLSMAPVSLFNKMTFAVSYVQHEKQKNNVIDLIKKHGGQILEDGFDSLFESIPKHSHTETELALATSSKALGFTALIADEHSRKAKYMQALALGLPCISGHWILACVLKQAIIDWSPYLLCAGQSLVLGNAYKSRMLKAYDATQARLIDTFAQRDKLLDGKNVLLVTGRGKGGEKRRAYVFLARALGPTNIEEVVDFAEARKRLVESAAEGHEFDLLYVDGNDTKAGAAVFSQGATTGTSKKRKRASTADEDAGPVPKKIRIISDETMVQSLILGQLLEE